jgi:hypothetical protein
VATAGNAWDGPGRHGWTLHCMHGKYTRRKVKVLARTYTCIMPSSRGTVWPVGCGTFISRASHVAGQSTCVRARPRRILKRRLFSLSEARTIRDSSISAGSARWRRKCGARRVGSALHSDVGSEQEEPVAVGAMPPWVTRDRSSTA